MTQATSDYLNRPLRSAEEMTDDLELDVARLTWLQIALQDTITEHANITRDYPFLGDDTAAAAQRERGAIVNKIAELKERIATLRGTP